MPLLFLRSLIIILVKDFLNVKITIYKLEIIYCKSSKKIKNDNINIFTRYDKICYKLILKFEIKSGNL